MNRFNKWAFVDLHRKTCKKHAETLQVYNMAGINKAYRYFHSYYALNPHSMKNEPVGSYNHMQEDEQSIDSINSVQPVPASLYMLLIIDAVLISALAVLAAQVIF